MLAIRLLLRSKATRNMQVNNAVSNERDRAVDPDNLYVDFSNGSVINTLW